MDAGFTDHDIQSLRKHHQSEAAITNDGLVMFHCPSQTSCRPGSFDSHYPGRACRLGNGAVRQGRARSTVKVGGLKIRSCQASHRTSPLAAAPHSHSLIHAGRRMECCRDRAEFSLCLKAGRTLNDLGTMTSYSRNPHMIQQSVPLSSFPYLTATSCTMPSVCSNSHSNASSTVSLGSPLRMILRSLVV